MKLAPGFHYAFLAPTPEGGWPKALVHRDEHSAIFALLAQPDAFSLLVYLQTRDRNSPFTVKFLEKHIGIPEARLERLLPDFLRLELMDARTLSLDDADTRCTSRVPVRPSFRCWRSRRRWRSSRRRSLLPAA